MTGRFIGGTRLKEMDLAVELKASRTPIREALMQLQSDGLVTLLPHRGAVVCPLTEKDVEDAFQLRALLEGYGASQAAHQITPAQVDSLERLCYEMERLPVRNHHPSNMARLLDFNDQFHRIVIQASGNCRIAIALRAVMEIPRVYRMYYWRADHERQRSFVYHREMVDAFRKGDALWAEATMKSHIHAARDYLLAKLRAAPLPSIERNSLGRRSFAVRHRQRGSRSASTTHQRMRN
jgi:DNA-binding GntR family transcriptional regulator